MHIVVKKTNGDVVIITPHPEKYEAERREVFKDVEVPISVPDPNNEGKFIEGKKTKTVLDRIINPFSEEKALQKYIDPNDPDFVGVVHEWFLIDEKPTKTDLESREQLYHDGTNEIKKDLGWEVRLMSDQVIKKKLLKNLSTDLDLELAKEDPSVIEVAKIQRNIQIIKDKKASNKNDDSFWLEKAIEGLDKRVSKGESDKQIVRAKLSEKLSELKK